MLFCVCVYVSVCVCLCVCVRVCVYDLFSVAFGNILMCLRTHTHMKHGNIPAIVISVESIIENGGKGHSEHHYGIGCEGSHTFELKVVVTNK